MEFFFIYFLIFLLGVFLLFSTGINYYSAFSIAIASLNNLGLGVGLIIDNFQLVNQSAKWFAILMMIFGRLEIFTFLIVFTPIFWKNCSMHYKK